MTEQPYPEALATVTACRYETDALRVLAFGIPSGRHFLISFNYWANGQLHTGEYRSATAVAPGTLFPITYDPAAPHEHSKSTPATRTPLIIFGILGSITLLYLWLIVIHGRR